MNHLVESDQQTRRKFHLLSARFDVLPAFLLKIFVSWYVTLSSGSSSPFLMDYLTLKMKALRSYEMLGTTYLAIEHHIPQGLNVLVAKFTFVNYDTPVMQTCNLYVNSEDTEVNAQIYCGSQCSVIGIVSRLHAG
jgi:hypothetical protein